MSNEYQEIIAKVQGLSIIEQRQLLQYLASHANTQGDRQWRRAPSWSYAAWARKFGTALTLRST